jgi:hypothetical protein
MPAGVFPQKLAELNPGLFGVLFFWRTECIAGTGLNS